MAIDPSLNKMTQNIHHNQQKNVWRKKERKKNHCLSMVISVTEFEPWWTPLIEIEEGSLYAQTKVYKVAWNVQHRNMDHDPFSNAATLVISHYRKRLSIVIHSKGVFIKF